MNLSSTNKQLMFILVLLSFCMLSCPCGAVLFRWLPSNALSDPKNWHPNGSVPCADDNVRLDVDDEAPVDQGISVAQLDGPLRAHIVTFPSNGLLYFGTHDTEFGTAMSASAWQCEKRDQPEDAIFNPYDNAPNFFDATNWQISSENSAPMPSLLRLDAEQVPSDEDRVLFPDKATSKVFIDVPARIKSFNISDQSLSSRKLAHLLGTVEGQFRFRMGVRISTEVNSRGHLQLRRPMDTVFTVVDAEDSVGGQRQQTLRAAFFGRPNSNFYEPQFSSLCGFVKCVPTEPYCAEPIQAIGQCCAQCGAMLRFRKNSLNFTLSRAIVDQFVRAQMALPHGAGVSFVRIDRDDFHPSYQISVLPNHPANFAESGYCSIMWSVFNKIMQRTINDHLSLQYQPADSAEFFDVHPKYSIQLGILHWNSVFKTIGLLAMVGIVLGIIVHAHYRRSPSFRLFVSQQHQSMHVVFFQQPERVEVIGEQREENNRRAGASFLEFVNRAFSWKVDKKEDEAKEEADDNDAHTTPSDGNGQQERI